MTLQALQLHQTRGDRTLFRDLSFVLQPGEALWVKGANGSGKTSLLRVLCGLSMPTGGEVRWQGEPVLRERGAFFRDVLYFSHASGVKDELLAWENVAISATLAGQSCTREQALGALASLGLSVATAHLPARALSQGQRKRVALARLCVLPARSLLVLDEPFTALDDASVAVLREVLDRHLEQGGLLVCTTHQPLALQAGRLHTLELSHDNAPWSMH